MSTSVVFTVDVRFEISRLEGLRDALESFLDDAGLADELPIIERHKGSVGVLRAASPHPLTISDAGHWLPETEERLTASLRAVDPNCRVAFNTRFPDEQPSLNTVHPTATERTVKVFYSFHGLQLPAEKAREFPCRALWMLLERMQRERDHFGLIDENDSTLQFDHDWDFELRAEIPSPSQQGSYAKRMTRDELRALLQSLPPRFEVEAIGGLTFAPW
jgi:hypothetical protein